jgi:uncharacterized protein
MEFAAIANDPEFLRIALDKGGDPNSPVSYGDRTILFEAVMNNRFVNVVRLVKAGADLNHADSSGSTPLHDAATIGNYDMVYELMMAGADPTRKNRLGNDPGAIVKRYGDRVAAGNREQRAWLEKVRVELKKRKLLV